MTASRTSSADPGYEAQVRQRVDALAKPPGSLPLLERLACFVARAQRTTTPAVRQPHVLVFAADHGVAEKNPVSAYPTAVTPVMVQTMLQGKAAISVLARQAMAHLWVIDVGVAGNARGDASEPIDPGTSFVDTRISAGTQDLAQGPAMSADELSAALHAGRAVVANAAERGADLLALGELGIGNTTPASAVAARLLEVEAARVTGPGTGLDGDGVARKTRVIDQALARLGSRADDPHGTLADLGGFELAALAGAMIESAARKIPVLLDGFVVGAAALAAIRLEPEVRHVLYPATRSAEPGHDLVLQELNLGEPIFDAGFRLGEASAAALAIPVCVSACRLLAEMATLEQVLP